MNDEIKEMLEQMESIVKTGKDKVGIKVDGYGLQQNEIKMFLDYITDLRQENERAEKEYKNKVDEIGKLTSRIYKAIEILKAMKHCDEWIGRERTNIIKILNILQNGSEE